MNRNSEKKLRLYVDALEKTNMKFKKRFQYLEEHARKDGKALYDMSLKEMDVYWEEAKMLEHKAKKD